MDKRESAFLKIFEAEFNADILMDETDESSATKTAAAIFEKLEIIDEKIKSGLKSWDIKRISRVAKAALRLCLYEISFKNVPHGASVNEAVNLTKKYAGDDEADFVNGVLRTIFKSEVRNGAEKPMDNEGEND